MRSCPVCKSSKKRIVLDLGNHPLADTFLPASRSLEPEVTYPLVLVQCEGCAHFFSGFPTEPIERYVANEYSYESANSALSVEHFRELAAACVREAEVPPEELSVLDVGSNDGTLLEQFRKRGVNRLMGVDPSPNMARIAEAKKIPTAVFFFSPENTPKLLDAKLRSRFDVVVSANVVNHADDPNLFLEAVSQTLSEDGIYVFEVPNVIDLVRFRAFETIYHEHVHYWSVESLRGVLQTHGFRIFLIEILDYMCGSIRVFASKSRRESSKVQQIIANDRETVTRNSAELAKFADDVRMTKFRTLKLLYARKLEGKRIVGIGAATKGNTLLNYFGLGHDVVEYITDRTTEKIGKITPGSKIPIVSDARLSEEDSSTVALILPWNLDAVLRAKFGHLGLEMVTPNIAFGEAGHALRPGIYGQG